MTREELIAALVDERFGAPPPRRIPRPERIHHDDSPRTEMLIDESAASRVEQASEMGENEAAGTSVGALARPDRLSLDWKEAAPVHGMHSGTACEDSRAEGVRW